MHGPYWAQEAPKRNPEGNQSGTQIGTQSRMLPSGVVEIAKRHSSANFHEATSLIGHSPAPLSNGTPSTHVGRNM
eukprot:3165680-Amphidinium_carterae.1